MGSHVTASCDRLLKALAEMEEPAELGEALERGAHRQRSNLPPGVLRQILSNRSLSLIAINNGRLSDSLKTSAKLALENNAKNSVNFCFQGDIGIAFKFPKKLVLGLANTAINISKHAKKIYKSDRPQSYKLVRRGSNTKQRFLGKKKHFYGFPYIG